MRLVSLLRCVYSSWCKGIPQVLRKRSAVESLQLMFYSAAGLGGIWHLYNAFHLTIAKTEGYRQ